MNPSVYRTSYSRALFKYANNEFLARYLDADDIAFIEGVRETGRLCCGSLADPTPTAATYSDSVINRVALIDEMDFWQSPYTEDKTIARRHGPPARPERQPIGSTPHAIARAQAKSDLEWARAEARREAEEKQREKLRRDIEWEQAAPIPLAFGKIKGRHYIPQWKLDEDRKHKLELNKQIHTELKNLKKYDPASVRILKAKIGLILRKVFPRAVTLETLVAKTGCVDLRLLKHCLEVGIANKEMHQVD